jgi:hypothetical protein
MEKKEYDKIRYQNNKELIKSKANIYRLKNRVKINLQKKQYRLKYKDKIKKDLHSWYSKNKYKIKIYNTRYRLDNKLKISKLKQKYSKSKYHSNLKYKLNVKICANVRISLKKKMLNKNKRSWEQLVGYSKEELKEHLLKNVEYSEQELLIKPIEIDHKTPISWFSFSSEKDLAFKNAWSLENLQLLSKEENRSKMNFYCADVLLALSLIGRG